MFSACGVGVEPRTPQNLTRIGSSPSEGLLNFVSSNLRRHPSIHSLVPGLLGTGYQASLERAAVLPFRTHVSRFRSSLLSRPAGHVLFEEQTFSSPHWLAAALGDGGHEIVGRRIASSYLQLDTDWLARPHRPRLVLPRSGLEWP